ncbi:IS110 family transposase [Mycobacterium sp. 852013-50091_SCH5140682]|uniref:IS110 family transposase n=1 Tax=Mycobacterium sp. 852013-50091_SCH5140682 TaxID=1834109 RepID=UPI0009ECD630|nr:IS110 family transposase [Mycobacterium sp. 852013-50091_SCH5140682]
MSKGSGLSRGDKRRNARLTRLRGLVPVEHAIVGIDLADVKQVVVLADHDSRVLVRKRVSVKAWDLGPVLDWAARQAHELGFAGVTVGCEPTGHRWRVLNELATQRGMAFVCVNPMLVGRARESEDYTRDKSDDRDAVLIARLVAQLHCYVPEWADETWARLRQLGARRERLVTEATACVQQLGDLLECAWPGVLDAAAKPFESMNWCAALAVVLGRCDGRPEKLSRLGLARFEAAVRRELPRWGGSRIRRGIVEGVFVALVDPTGVWAQRRGALERAGWVLDDWHTAKARLVEVETRMVDVLDTLELTELVTSIPGISAVGAAAMLAETGDPARFDSPRALVKHAGLCPRDNASGAFSGRSRISRRGRPGLRLAAWRAVWGALAHNPVMAARYRYLTTRQDNPLTDGQARAAIAAALLRWLHVTTTRKVRWDATRAGAEVMPIAA